MKPPHSLLMSSGGWARLSLIGAAGALFIAVSTSVIFLTAFEAHVVNVTAQIERPPLVCDPRSKGYWANNEGCSQGTGESVWADEVHPVSMEFSGIFFNITGQGICQALWTPNCPSGNNIPAARCRAKAHALANELNIASGRMPFDALLGGADDGSFAFDRLGLTYNSTIRQALERIEYIIGNGGSTRRNLNDAAYVAMRIIAFYENENEQKPMCVTDPLPPDECRIDEQAFIEVEQEIEVREGTDEDVEDILEDVRNRLEGILDGVTGTSTEGRLGRSSRERGGEASGEEEPSTGTSTTSVVIEQTIETGEELEP